MSFDWIVLIGLAIVIALGIGLVFFGEGKSSEDSAVEVAFVGGAGSGSAAPPIGLRDSVNRLLQPLADRDAARAQKRNKPALALQLARADLKLKASEFVLIQLGAMLLLGLIGLVVFSISIQTILLIAAGWFAPGIYLGYRVGKRLKAFNNLLGDTLMNLSNSLRAGYSFPQAINVVASRGIPPISDEFQRVIREVNLGSTVEDALNKMVVRVNSPDLDLVVTAIAINRQIGGNLAEILENISMTIRERVRIKGEISTLTAQARMSGQLITFLPITLGVFLYFTTPTYFRPMTSNPIGWFMLGIAAVMIFLGNAIIKKIVSIEV